MKPDLADRRHEAHFLWSPTLSDVFNPFAGLPSTEGRPGTTLREELTTWTVWTTSGS